MLEKYLKFIKGGKAHEAPAETGEQPAPAAGPSQSSPLPLLDPLVSAEREVVDTAAIAAGNVVASVLDVQTSGESSSLETLRRKIIGRQPVLDRSQRIVGYELLLRSKAQPTNRQPDAALRHMQDEALIRCLAELDERLFEDKIAFAAVSADMLVDPLLLKLPNKGMTLAVGPGDTKADEFLLRCRALRSLGYRIALDDCHPELIPAPLLSLAAFVRVDILKFDAIELEQIAARFLNNPGPLLVAMNVATEEDFDACRKIGFQCFEGNYFTGLRPSQPPRIDNDRIRVMELLDMVRNQTEISKLEEVFKRDAVLSYKLLRYINAPANGFPHKIRSIAHALVIFGYDHLYRWLTLLLFTSGTPDARSRALMQNALVRARMTELLGYDRLPLAEREGLFIVGIFSLLDALLNVPMDQALERLKLSDQVVAALARREGVYAPFLGLAVACEEADEDAIDRFADACGLDANAVNIAQVKALIWAEEIDS
ncbi:MAG: HDOD domain-containing protein [Sulfuricella sp.]|nr:HDOD domain-containing protein [Sulfuricella sp.]